METIFSIWKRRLITIPLCFMLCLLFLVTSPIWILVGVIYNFAKHDDWTLLRTLCFFALYVTVVSLGILWAFVVWLTKPFYKTEYDFRRANRHIQRWYAMTLFIGGKKLYGLKVDIQGLEAFEEKEPVLICCRHASSADTMFPLVLPPHMKNMRYVIKAELLNDPGLDVVGHRFPNVFVRRGGENSTAEIRRVAALCDALPHNGAVVIYPEGTRFTPEKRERLLAKFEGTDEKLFAITKALKKTLSPLRGGGLALTQSMPKNSDVIFISHRGIDKTGSFKDLLDGNFTHAHLEIIVWRVKAEDVPRDVRGSERFLLENWLKVDAWAQGKSIEEAMTIDELLKENPEIYFGPRRQVSLESLEGLLPELDDDYDHDREAQKEYTTAAMKAAVAAARAEQPLQRPEDTQPKDAVLTQKPNDDDFAEPDEQTSLIEIPLSADEPPKEATTE